MAGFFSDDDSSDVETSAKLHRNLESIRAAAATDEAESTRETENTDEILQITEEAEMQRLRSSTRYQQYAARKNADVPKSTSVAKRPRSTGVSSDEGYGNGPNKGTTGGGAVAKQTGLSTGKGIPDSTALLRNATSGGRSVYSQENAGSRRPRVDPKIIDDSSDDDSCSKSDSSDAPIGPLLPNATRSIERALEELPIKNEVTLGASHSSHVSCIALERSGNRLVTGSIDSVVKLWDFNSMTKSLRSFKSITPLDEAPVRNVQFSPAGGLLLCSGGGSSVIVMDRDGHVVAESVKGDMYIVDKARTKGHVANISSAKWRPGSCNAGKVIATSSADGTFRLWDITRTTRIPMMDNPVISQLKVTKLRTARGGKASATAMDWMPDGKACVLGCTDGKIRVIDPEAHGVQGVYESREILRGGAEVTSLTTAPESHGAPLLLVRSTDDCLRVFDRRDLNSPLKEFYDLDNAVSETNASFVGERAEYFLTGTSANPRDLSKRGTLRLFETKSLQEIWKSELHKSIGSVVCTLWQPGLNQIVYGSADGKVRVLYNPQESSRGVLNCLSKSDYRKSQGAVSVGTGEIYTASELHDRMRRQNGHETGRDASLTKEPVSKRRRREVSEAMKPKPFSGPMTNKDASSMSLAKRLAAAEVSEEWSRDPREAILRYAEIAKKDPMFTSAYKTTQPETILTQKTAEQEEEESRQAIYARDLLRKKKRNEST